MPRLPRRPALPGAFAACGAALTAAGAAFLALSPRPPLREGLGFSRAVYAADGRLLRLTLAPDEGLRLWRPLSDHPPRLVEAVLLQEDRWFRGHPGVNPGSALRALRRSYASRGRRVGGSTITMQLARIRFGLRTRTPAGKLAQMARALQLERHYSKEEILEAYLNLVPMGGNVLGMPAASLAYFGKDVARLGVPESLALAVIPQSPARRGGRGEESWRRAGRSARLALFKRWLMSHPRDERLRAQVAAAEPGRRPLPFLAPHLAEAALRDHPGKDILRTTLDTRLQSLLERRGRAYVERARGRGIRNVAALLVDHRDMEVRALLGSVNYLDASIQGQVNGARAKRSPGSALKPFLYGLAMDQGLVHPLTALKDAPASFGGYNPENFDRDFAGPISARDALLRSRNVPAVVVAAQLSSPTFHAWLVQAGISGLREERHYGLTLALGGAEVTMEELARLYAMLANGGLDRPLRYLQEDPAAEPRRLLSEEAAWMVLDILKDNPRPGQGFRQEWAAGNVPAYWKTGTSFGFRDAWAAGIYGPYVLVVWAGNFNGEGNPALVGAEAAAPLWFDIADALSASGLDLRSPRGSGPANLTRVEVCALTGGIPGPHCRAKARTWFIPGVSPIRTCEVHREVLVDSATGRRACGPGPGVRAEAAEFWPSDLLEIFRRAGLARRPPPPDDPDCPLDQKAASGIPPRITSPQQGMAFVLRASEGPARVPLKAVTDADARAVHWFVDGRYAGRSAGGEAFWWTPVPGRAVVRAVDDRGRSDSREIRVAVEP